MAGRIFLLNGDAQLVAMEETCYESEALLQELLAHHPDLLAGDQIDSESPRRWLLVTREMSVPGSEEGAGRWSLDHLFLDQEAIPTLVEVKRSTDTRIRREVIGQMLDYAANAVAYWPMEGIRAAFETRCQTEESNPEEELGELLGEDEEKVNFWQQVQTNLQAGRIRMVFIADTIPPELRRVVEFLNEQMNPAEVIAIEVKQFTGEGMKTLVPRVLGQTEAARQKRQAAGRSQPREAISEGEFLSALDAVCPPEVQQVARRLIAWARQRGLKDNFKRGGKGAAFLPLLRHDGKSIYPVSIQHGGKAILQMRTLMNYSPFDGPAKRNELHDRLKHMPGLRVTEFGFEGFPSVPLSSLTDEARFLQFTDAFGWMIDELRKT